MTSRTIWRAWRGLGGTLLGLLPVVVVAAALHAGDEVQASPASCQAAGLPAPGQPFEPLYRAEVPRPEWAARKAHALAVELAAFAPASVDCRCAHCRVVVPCRDLEACREAMLGMQDRRARLPGLDGMLFTTERPGELPHGDFVHLYLRFASEVRL